MATPYQLIYDKFIKLLKNDNSFFNYSNMTDQEIEEAVNDHLQSLLNRSIDRLYEYGSPDINFYEKDDEIQEFEADLISQEISLLSNLMYLNYLDEEKNKLKSLGISFRSSELNLFSPAAERRTFLEMLKDIETDVINSLSNYYSRDRLTWKLKSIYGDPE